MEHGSKTTKQVGVELELQGNSPNDVVADTHETPETTAEEPDVEQGSKTTKQVGVELELQGTSPSDVVANTHETPETTAEEPDVKQGSKTTKQVGVEVELWRKSPSDLVLRNKLKCMRQKNKKVIIIFVCYLVKKTITKFEREKGLWERLE